MDAPFGNRALHGALTGYRAVGHKNVNNVWCHMRGTFKVSKSKLTKAETIVSGAATITLDQSMAYSKRCTRTGSIAGDWHAVGRDVSRALSTVKREFTAA